MGPEILVLFKVYFHFDSGLESRESLAVARVWFCGVAQISLIQDPPSHKILTDKNPIIMDLHKYNFSAKSCGMEKREREI